MGLNAGEGRGRSVTVDSRRERRGMRDSEKIYVIYVAVLTESRYRILYFIYYKYFYSVICKIKPFLELKKEPGGTLSQT